MRDLLSRFLRDTYEYSTATTPISIDPPSPATSNNPVSHIRVLSLNIWALMHVPSAETRTAYFLEHVMPQYDIIALQEVWHERERAQIVSSAFSAGLVYSHIWTQGVGFPGWAGSSGTGLMLLSRYPITEVFWKRYSINGKPYKLLHLDYMGAKGMGVATVRVPGAADVDVYCTHLHACYVDQKHELEKDEYIAHRVSQAYEAAQLIRRSRKPSLSVLMGDLNSSSASIVIQLFKRYAGLTSATEQLCSAQDCGTFGTRDNIYSYSTHSPSQLDHIMYCSSNWSLTHCAIVKTRLPDSTPLSDHWAVEAQFDFTPCSLVPSLEYTGVLESILHILRVKGIQDARSRRTFHGLRGVLFLLLAITLKSMIPDAVLILLSIAGTMEILLCQMVVTDEICAFQEVQQQIKTAITYDQ